MRRTAAAAINTALPSSPTMKARLTLARQLIFNDRARTQETIERVYCSHQNGMMNSPEEAVMREVIEKKVRADS